MKNKYLLTGYSVIVMIGVCCAGIGIDEAYSSSDGDIGNFSRWLGKTNMAFSTSVVIGSIGVALFLIGKYLIHHDKIIRKIYRRGNE